jgi:hypothetical protein
MGRREVGGQIWRYDTAVELKELPRSHLEPKIDYKSILPDWGLFVLRARRASIILYSVPSRNSLPERGTIFGMYSVCMKCM